MAQPSSYRHQKGRMVTGGGEAPGWRSQATWQPVGWNSSMYSWSQRECCQEPFQRHHASQGDFLPTDLQPCSLSANESPERKRLFVLFAIISGIAWAQRLMPSEGVPNNMVFPRAFYLFTTVTVSALIWYCKHQVLNLVFFKFNPLVLRFAVYPVLTLVSSPFFICRYFSVSLYWVLFRLGSYSYSLAFFLQQERAAGGRVRCDGGRPSVLRGYLKDQVTPLNESPSTVAVPPSL